MEALRDLLGEDASADLLAALLAAHDGDVGQAAAAYFDQAEGRGATSSAASWVCAVCTLENAAGSSACVACETPNASASRNESASVKDTALLERDISTVSAALVDSDLLIGLSEHEPTRGSKVLPR